MKIVSIDVETTGLDPDNHQLVELGAVVFDDANADFKYSTFQRYVKHDTLVGSYQALIGNSKILENTLIAEKENKVSYPDTVLLELREFLEKNNAFTEQYGKLGINALGKNLATFDLRFMEKLNGYGHLHIRRRVLDVAQFYYDSSKDVALPNLQECKERSEIFLSSEVAHTALEDAIDTARLWHHGIDLILTS